MNFDLSQYIGLSGIPLVEQVVQYFKNELRMPAYLAPIVALVVAVGLNVGIAEAAHTNLLTGIEIGLLTGFGSSFWHEVSKSGTVSQ